MLHSKILKCRFAQYYFQRGYLSQNFKESFNNQLNNMYSVDIASQDSFNEFLEMRKDGSWHLVPQLTSHLVVKNYLETGKTNDLLSILKNKLETRIFVDDYTGSYLLDHLIETGDHLSGVEIVTAFQEEFTNELVVALSLKSIYSYLKGTNLSNTEEASKPEKKERVGFLRNNEIITSELLKKETIGKAILNLSHTKNSNILVNMHLIGLCLCERFDDVKNLLKQYPNMIHKDIWELCLSFGKEISFPHNEYWNSSLNFDDIIDKFVKEAASKHEAVLIDLQKNKYSKWIAESKTNEENAKTSQPSISADDADQIVKDLEAERKLLWYFDNKDKIDLKIFQQKKFYPKKWFGKKKKPKTIDDKYVPPEVIKRVN